MFSLICAWINGWVNNREAGPCPTTAIWRRRKNSSQWQRNFQWKLHSHWLEFLRQRLVAVVRQGPGVLRRHHAQYDAIAMNESCTAFGCLQKSGWDLTVISGSVDWCQWCYSVILNSDVFSTKPINMKYWFKERGCCSSENSNRYQGIFFTHLLVPDVQISCGDFTRTIVCVGAQQCHQHGKAITCIIKRVVKLLIHSQTSTIAVLKFGNG